jgi:hypothetical protein
MSRTRRHAASPIQLFPFLAVLVSALGALVLLLVAVNRQVTIQAAVAARQALLQQTKEGEAALTGNRIALQRELTSLKAQIRAVHDQQRVLESKMESTRREAGANTLRFQALKQSVDEVRETRVANQARIEAIRREIAAIDAARSKMKDQAQEPDVRFVPLVHPGANGTARQPIYLECSALGITVQPEGVLFPAQALQGPEGQAALARVIQILSQHYLERDVGKDVAHAYREWEPYPLLLIRPDGATLSYVARGILEQSNLPFGYELIEADWKLQFPESDPVARNILLAALDARRTGGGVPRDSESGALSGPGAFRGVAGRSNRPDGQFAIAPNLGRILGFESPSSAVVAGNSTHERGEGQPLQLRPADDRSGDNSNEDQRSPRGTPRAAPRTQPSANPPSSSESTKESGISTGRHLRSTAAGNSSASHSESSSGIGNRERNALPDSEGGSYPAGELDQILGTASSNRARFNSTVPIPRNIEIECYADGLLIRNSRRFVRVQDPADMKREMPGLVEAVRRTVAAWGPSGTIFHWQPTVHCLIHAGGLEMYYGLWKALSPSSFTIQHVLLARDGLDWTGTMFLGELARDVQPGPVDREAFFVQGITLDH